jgi:glutamate-1-semialdehyde 2,1-aminomutase
MQSRQLDEKSVIESYKKRTRGSAALFEKAQRVSPGGVMAGIKFFPPHPLFMRKASGSRTWDVDNNEYIDYLMSYGALILGHGHPSIKRAVDSVLQDIGTTVTGTPTEVEVEYGRMLLDLYNRDGLLRFTNSGLEATLLAVRLARAYTRKRRVAKFEGHYHGANDQLLVSYKPELAAAGGPDSPKPVSDSMEVDGLQLADSLVLPFNDWESTERLIRENAGKLSCVILEPFEDGVIPGERAFMTDLRRLTADLRIPLIYDEVKTGFRVRLGGASEFYSIVPDITCLGKIIGGGLPVGAVAGNREIMNLLDPRGAKGATVFHSGTFNGNPLVMSAGMATVETLMSDGKFGRIVANTDSLKKRFAASLAGHQIQAAVVGEGGMFGYFITAGDVKNYRDAERSDLRFRRILDLATICEGVYVKPTGRYSVSLAHSDDDLRLTAERFEQALDAACVPARN